MKRAAFLDIIGFLLFTIGFLSIFLSLVGLNFSFLSWMNNLLGSSLAFLIHIIMIMVGLILIYLNRQMRNYPRT
jgi:uncharacterized membrane protein